MLVEQKKERELEKPWKFQLGRSETISKRREDSALGDGWRSKGLGSGLRIEWTSRTMSDDSQPMSLVELDQVGLLPLESMHILPGEVRRSLSPIPL